MVSFFRKKEPDFQTMSGLNRSPIAARIVIVLTISILCILCVLPFVNVLAVSFSSASAIYLNPHMLIPSHFTLEAYKYIFKTRVLIDSLKITVFATVIGTLFNLIATTSGAYALMKNNVPGQKIMLWIILIPMFFGAGLIPTYLLLRNLGLIDSVWVLVILGLVAPFNLILMRNFFWTIPDSLIESAEIDGASDLAIFARIILPMSKSVLATIGLFYAVGHWNDYFTGLFYINSNHKWPLQVVLKSIIIDFNMAGMGNIYNASSLNQNDMLQAMVLQPENIRAACIIFSIVPILLLYPLLQRYFVKGIVIGAVKG
ncbi:MAG: carbohydrate ABC transporter permease [Christensenellales bacterium]|jgi:putative aldouronate transport system permease protein